jgi:hypothetical protein
VFVLNMIYPTDPADVRTQYSAFWGADVLDLQSLSFFQPRCLYSGVVMPGWVPI